VLLCPGLCCEEYWGQLLEGQSFLCVSFGAEHLNAAARLLTLPLLFMYDWNMPLELTTEYPAIADLIQQGTSMITSDNRVSCT
jgi:hypothetical protein